MLFKQLPSRLVQRSARCCKDRGFIDTVLALNHSWPPTFSISYAWSVGYHYEQGRSNEMQAEPRAHHAVLTMGHSSETLNAVPMSGPDLARTLAWFDTAAAEARVRYPEVAITEPTFVESILRALGREGLPALDELASLHGADLFLTQACLAGVPGALDALQRVYLSDLGRHLRFLQSDEGLLADVKQDLCVKLLVGPPPRKPSLASYRGVGALGGWIAVSARRVALSLVRERAAGQRRLRRLTADESSPSTLHPAETDYVRRKYAAPFSQAFRAALGSLPARERAILRLNLIERVSLDRIACIYGVSQSTVSRWVMAAQQAVFQQVQRVLVNDWKIQAAEFDSLVAALISHVNITISEPLRDNA